MRISHFASCSQLPTPRRACILSNPIRYIVGEVGVGVHLICLRGGVEVARVEVVTAVIEREVCSGDVVAVFGEANQTCG